MRTLSDLHNSHKGIEKMQHLARAHVFWPRIDADILNYVKRCTICTRYKVTQVVQPMLPREILTDHGRTLPQTISDTMERNTS